MDIIRKLELEYILVVLLHTINNASSLERVAFTVNIIRSTNRTSRKNPLQYAGAYAYFHILTRLHNYPRETAH